GKLLNRPDLIEMSKLALREISKNLGARLHGMFTIDFKENSVGKPLITEINIRHVSFNHAFTLGGINFAETTIKAVFGMNVDQTMPTQFATENYFIRGVDAPLRLIPIEQQK